MMLYFHLKFIFSNGSTLSFEQQGKSAKEAIARASLGAIVGQHMKWDSGIDIRLVEVLDIKQ